MKDTDRLRSCAAFNDAVSFLPFLSTAELALLSVGEV